MAWLSAAAMRQHGLTHWRELEAKRISHVIFASLHTVRIVVPSVRSVTTDYTVTPLRGSFRRSESLCLRPARSRSAVSPVGTRPRTSGPPAPAPHGVREV